MPDYIQVDGLLVHIERRRQEILKLLQKGFGIHWYFSSLGWLTIIRLILMRCGIFVSCLYNTPDESLSGKRHGIPPMLVHAPSRSL
jgi:hypothetical protein